MNTGVLLAAAGTYESGVLAGIGIGFFIAVSMLAAFVLGGLLVYVLLTANGYRRQQVGAPQRHQCNRGLRPIPVAPAPPVATVVPVPVAVPAVEPPLTAEVVVDEVAAEEITVGPPVKKSGHDARPKFFLSYAAVVRAIFDTHATLKITELDNCLFCISKAELALALKEEDKSGRDYYELLMPAIDKAKKEGRLLYTADTTRFKPISYGQVNEFLARNKVAPLFIAGGMGDTLLEAIPMYACVPRISDNSYEILWAQYPLIGDWHECWGDPELAERLELFLASDSPLDRAIEKGLIDAGEPEGSDDQSPLSVNAAWMKDLGKDDQRPVINTGFRPDDAPADEADGDGKPKA